VNDYLNIIYNENTRPFTKYPKKLISFLYNKFQMQKHMKLLEPGCGRGEHLRLFRDLGLDVYGMDISPEAQSLASDLNISLCDLDSQDMPYPDNYFDVVYSKSFLEHIREPSVFLKEAMRVLKPGGLLLSMVPDWESQHKTFYDDYTHIHPFTIVSLKNIQLVIGFEKVNVFKFRQLPIVWNNPILNYLLVLISPFIPVRTRIPFFRWARELMLIGYGYKPR